MAADRDKSVAAEWWGSVDRGLLTAIVFLALCGVVTSLVATPQAALHLKLEPFYFAKRHAEATIAALFIVLGVSFLEPHQVRRLALALFLGGLALMLAALLQGAERNGAVRWLYFGGVVLQPSEFVKPGFAILSAWFLAESVRRPDMPALELAILMLIVFAALLILQPDMGQTVLAASVWCGLFFLAGYSLRLLPLLGGLAVALIFLAYKTMPHVAARIDRFAGHLGDAHQTAVAAAAFRDAGWLGHGFGEAFAKQRLPDAHNDYVFAAIAEELGIAACLFLILIYGLIVWKGYGKAIRETDAFVRLSVIGLIMVFGFQALVNIAVNVSLLPAKGVTLPFLSYGRSSLISTALTMGMLLALTRRRIAAAPNPLSGSNETGWITLRWTLENRGARRHWPRFGRSA